MHLFKARVLSTRSNGLKLIPFLFCVFDALLNIKKSYVI